MSDAVAVILSPEELRVLSEVWSLLPESHPLRHSISCRILSAALSIHSSSHWVGLKAQLEAACSVLSEINPAVPSIAGAPITLSSDTDHQVSWAGFARRLAAVTSPITGLSVQALVAEQARRISTLQGELATAREAPSAAIAKPVIDEALARAEAQLQAAHACLTELGVDYHPDLIERIRLLKIG